MINERVDAVLPTAAGLVQAVARRDAARVAQIVTAPDLDWRALVVVLADNVGCVRDLRVMHPVDNERRERRCPGCGNRGRRTVDRCISCVNALVGGRWVNHRGVMRWEAAS